VKYLLRCAANKVMNFAPPAPDVHCVAAGYERRYLFSLDSSDAIRHTKVIELPA